MLKSLKKIKPKLLLVYAPLLEKIFRKSPNFHYLILFLLIYPVIFIKLGGFTIRWWDESMFAVNTYEMISNGKWFSFYFDNHPDLYNCKPPLTCWLQIIFVKLLGYNELALRLPSGIASALTTIILFKFVSDNFNKLLAWVSVLILITSPGFIHFHTSRTADSDSLLTLFLLLANIYFIRFIISKNQRNILFLFIFITLAFATKLYAAVLFVPAYLIFLIYKGLLKKFVFNFQFFIGIAVFLISTGSLVYIRELDSPGYIHEIVFKGAGRVFTIVENHKESALFYFDNLFQSRFSIWFSLFMMGTPLLFCINNVRQREIMILFLSYILVYLIITMVSITKLIWYDMPLFPYLSVIAAYPVYLLIKNVKVNEKALSTSMTYALVTILFLYPYFMMFRKSQANTIENGEKKLEANEIYLHQKIKANYNLDGVKVYYQGWKGSLLFYQYKLAENNQEIELITNASKIMVDDAVLVCNDSLKAILSNKFNLKLINHENNADLYRIVNDKMDSEIKASLYQKSSIVKKTFKTVSE